MLWGGSTVYTLWGYQPITTPSVNWLQASNGKWYGYDRTASEDIFEAAILFKGSESSLSTLESVLSSNRENFNITCGIGEEIFGADIDYSGAIDATVIKYGNIQSINKGVYSMPMRLRAISPSVTGTASISSLRLSSHKFSPNSSFDINKSFSIDGTPSYLDRATDPGMFIGVFKQTTTEMKAIRRYLLTTARNASVSFPSFGVSKPFGQRMGSGPITIKIVGWRDLGRKNFTDWEISIKMANDS